MNKQQFLDVIEWQKKTFPNATELSKLKHLEKEIKELIEAVENNDPEKGYEYADILILIIGALNEAGCSFEDISILIDNKMKINREREWGKPNADGVVEHIRD